MSTSDWHISKPTKFCHTCGKPLEAGHAFFSALREDAEEGLVRTDFCAPCWDTAERDKLFSYWKARPAEENKAKRRVANDAVVLDFFWQLADADTEQKRRFRFAVALYLIRRRIFKLKEIRRAESGELLILSYPKGDGGEIEVPSPELTEEAIEQATLQLNQLLDVEM